MPTLIDLIEDKRERPVAIAVCAPATVTTTLYDLMATFQDIVGPGNDRLVVATVAHMLTTGSITLRRDLALKSGEPLACTFPSGQGRPYGGTQT
jgi:hypothetical protein